MVVSIEACPIGTLAQGLRDPRVGEIFCSIEAVRGTGKVYDEDRFRFRVPLPFPRDRRVFAEFGTKRFVADNRPHRSR